MVSGTAQLSGTTLSANEAKRGGGIFVVNNATIVNSTLSGNAASLNQGGGIWSDGVTAIDNSTVAFNAGVGVFIYFGALAINSSIVAKNLLTQNSQDSSATCVVCQSSPSGSHNLMTGSTSFVLAGTITQDPKLAPLADNGGPTLTHALKIGSPAIDTGAVNFSLDFDQRFDGHPRVIGSAADIGAFELDTVDVIFFDGFE